MSDAAIDGPTAIPLDDLPRAALRGIGQVMFQNHAVTGLFFLVGIAVASPWMALGAAIGTVVGLLTAAALRYDRDDIRDGIYGFNSVLVGIALLFYHPPSVVTFAVLVVACAAAVPVTHAMRRFLPFPSYTAPFIVTTWVALAAMAPFDAAAAPPPSVDLHDPELSGVVEGLGEVMFQANWMTGLLFLVGIAWNSRGSAAAAFGGSLVGLVVASWHRDPASNIAIGIYGYNAALAAIALWLYRPSLVFPLLAAAISVPITEAFPSLDLATLTAPFVVAAWVALALANVEHQFQRAHGAA